jgi:hypothetical protein
MLLFLPLLLLWRGRGGVGAALVVLVFLVFVFFVLFVAAVVVAGAGACWCCFCGTEEKEEFQQGGLDYASNILDAWNIFGAFR